MDQRQTARQAQSLQIAVSQTLVRSLKMLEMTQLELAACIEEEVSKNPLLETRFKNKVFQAPENTIEAIPPPSLYEFLCSQIRDVFSGIDERRIAISLLHQLDERGFLSPDVDISALHDFVRKLQTLDPPGIFATSLQECFLLQLVRMGHANTLAYAIVADSFDDFLHRRYGKIKTKHRIGPHVLECAIRLLSTLAMRPAAAFAKELIPPIYADLKLTQNDTKWRVALKDDFCPDIKIKEEYLAIHNLPEDEMRALREYAASAKRLLQTIEKRKRFLLALAHHLALKQASFLNQKGALIPISIQELAAKFSVHESTIYRALSQKYLETPIGLMPLSFLVVSSSSDPIKERIRKLIAREDKLHPLTDEQILHEMKKTGCLIARRTVSKYRKSLNILPASVRKHLA